MFGGDDVPRRRVAVLLEYDGTAYSGSQYQDNGPSIQSELEAAIQKLTHERARAAFAGRTDAGVHALGQVAAFDVGDRWQPVDLARGLNHFLPDDIAIRSARSVAPAFDPRRDARKRAYRYRIDNRPVRSPLERNRAWQVERALDVAAMQRAAASIEGKHDFAAFAGPYEGSTVRTLERCEPRAGRCGSVTLDVEARSFLPHQVRRTMGALVEVGLARMSEAAFAALLGAAPSTAGPVAPACGLYLLNIEYDGLEWSPDIGDGTKA